MTPATARPLIPRRILTLALLPLTMLVFVAAPTFAVEWDSYRPDATRLNAMVPSPAHPDHVFSFDGEHALWRSTDAGQSFQPVPCVDLYLNGTIPGLVFDPDDPGRWWVHLSYGLFEYDAVSDSLQRIPFPDLHVLLELVYHPGDGALYAYGSMDIDYPEFPEFRLFRSMDGGENWELRHVYGPNGVHTNTPYTADGALLGLLPFAHMSAGELVISHDGGNSWEWVGDPDPDPPLFKSPILVHPGNPDVLIVTRFDWPRTEISYDGGQSFTPLTGPWGDGPAELEVQITASGDIFVITDDNLWVSDDVGQSWSTALDDPSTWILHRPTGHAPRSVSVHPRNPQHLYLDGDIEDSSLIPWRSLDGGATWSFAVDGPAVGVQRVYTGADSPFPMVAQVHGNVFFLPAPGDDWRHVTYVRFTGWDGIAVNPVDPLEFVWWKHHYNSTVGQFWRTTDGGLTITEHDRPALGLFSLRFDPYVPGRMLTSAWPNDDDQVAIYASPDGGETWNELAAGGTTRGDLLPDPQTPGRWLFWETNDDHQLFESLDGGFSWTLFDDNDDREYLNVGWEPDGPGMVATVNESGDRDILKASDRLNPVWHHLTFPDAPGYPTRLFHGGDGHYFLEMSSGGTHGPRLYATINDHEGWELVLEAEPIRDARRFADGRVIAACEYQGGVLLSTTPVGVDEGGARAGREAANRNQPRWISLHSTYPNPFNGQATVTVDVPRATRLTVRLVNLLGQPVAVLAQDRATTPGTLTLSLDGTRLASGPYLITAIDHAGHTATQRITLVK